MNEIIFNDKLEEKISYIKQSLKTKAREYAGHTNRYSNFERAAKISKTLPEVVMFNYMLKHFVSYIDMLETLQSNPNVKYDEAYIKEKFGDIINYFILSEIYFLHNNCIRKQDTIENES